MSRLFEPPKKFIEKFVKGGQIVADLGCGPGFYTMHFTRLLGPKGKVFSVDSDDRCIKALKRKAKKKGFQNIETYAKSASKLDFIKENSIDFVFANGLLCSMAPSEHKSAVEEIKRILKPEGSTYLSVVKGSISYMEAEEWEDILSGFKIIQRIESNSERTVEVSLKL